jgi:hypothetical protein
VHHVGGDELVRLAFANIHSYSCNFIFNRSPVVAHNTAGNSHLRTSGQSGTATSSRVQHILALCMLVLGFDCDVDDMGSRGDRTVGLSGFLYNLISPSIWVLSAMNWAMGVVPILVLRKFYLTGENSFCFSLH